MQTRMMSLMEAIANVAVGYGVSVIATVLILRAFGYPVSGGDALAISGAFTMVSLARGYLLRRLFEMTARKVARP